MRILICHHHRFELWCAPAWLRDRLARDFPKIDFVYLPSYDVLSGQIPDADVLIGWSIRPDQFAAARKLKWIHSPAAAVHQLMFPELIKSEVVVTNSGDVHGPVVAEHAIALLLALAKRIPQAMRYQRKREWAQEILARTASSARSRRHDRAGDRHGQHWPRVCFARQGVGNEGRRCPRKSPERAGPRRCSVWSRAVGFGNP